MNNQQVNQLEKILSTYYQIGTLKEYQQLHLGYVNISYIIETEIAGVRKKYFLRRYKQGIKEEEIAFEHSVIAHLTAKGYNLIANVVKTKDGKTFIIRSAGRDRRKEFFYAVFDFLPGEDRYSWVNPTCTDKEVEGAAVVLAQFHNAVSDLIPAGRRYELGIMELLPEIAAYVDSCTQRPGSTVFDSYIQMHFALIQDAITKTQLALEHQDHQKMSRHVIHNDYHPGNLKFRDSDIIGLFDFDWSKIDYRCFDIALAITYFFSAWEGQQDGELQLDKTELFIAAYQNTLKGTPGLGPLSDLELKCLPHMISASNLYVLNWTITDFYGNKVDPDEYLVYLRHGVNFIKWLEMEENWRKLDSMVAKVAVNDVD